MSTTHLLHLSSHPAGMGGSICPSLPSLKDEPTRYLGVADAVSTGFVQMGSWQGAGSLLVYFSSSLWMFSPLQGAAHAPKLKAWPITSIALDSLRVAGAACDPTSSRDSAWPIARVRWTVTHTVAGLFAPPLVALHNDKGT